MDKISNSWIGRLFRARDNVVELHDDGLVMAKLAQDSWKLDWQLIERPPVFRWSFLGMILELSAGGRDYIVPYLGYFSKARYRHKVADLWVAHHQERLFHLIEDIQHQLNRGYLRRSHLAAIKTRVAREHSRWLPLFGRAEQGELPERLTQALNMLGLLYHLQDRDIVKLRRRYLESQLVAYADFFDRVESNPLTLKQRLACVTDDDNNLLLAGAGTGKTSVMVGRAGYLLESGQAAAKDILLLAYGSDAATEMNQRIKLKLGNDAIKASTFHSLGLHIISQVEGRAPSICPWVADGKAKQSWVNQALESLLLNEQYRQKIVAYFSRYYYVEQHAFDFKILGDYLEYLSANDIRSLKGEQVKSFGELYIANWLFCSGIDYRYQQRYQHKVSDPDFRAYQPDFYLPEYDLYIEYYGIDEQGNTASYIDREQYQASMAWKSAIHRQYNTPLIELFYYQHQKGELLARLQQELSSAAVKCEPLPDDVILATLRESGRITELATLFTTLIGLTKSACLDETGLQQAIAGSADPRQSAKAFELLQPVLDLYQQHLSRHDLIDFEDMIARALAYLDQGKFSSPWRYIMVDEFQDISEPRARLVRALRNSNAQCSLFCVGDDWQAIYRFSGSDVRLTTGFSEYFGPAAITALDLTFRFNNSIGEVATRFVTQNPGQLSKQIGSLVSVSKPAVSVVRCGAQQSSSATDRALEQVLTALSKQVTDKQVTDKQAAAKQAAKPASVYLLARFRFQLPDRQALAQLKARYGNLEIECLSLHGSKGREADYVVLLAVAGGKHGFPSTKQIPPLVEALLPQGEGYAFAEERRLFYVALTRARHRVYVLADMAKVSPFVTELIDNNYDIELDEFETSFARRLMAQMSCVRCDSGSLIERPGKFGAFYACSNYPRCDHKERGCATCGSPMIRERVKGFKVCLNEGCDNEIPLCDACGAEMYLRDGPRGKFWGCRNYRGKESPSCNHTKSF